MPPSLKRKSNPEVPHTPSKRLRIDGLFTPRVKAPTGPSRSVLRASRYQSSPASPAKRTLDEEKIEQGSSSKVRILDNRECLHLLPSRKPMPLPLPVPKLQRKTKTRRPVKNAIIARLSRRKAILQQKQKLEHMERMDSDDVYYFSEGLSDDIKLFTSHSPASFSSFCIEIPDMEMDIEEPANCTATITSDIPSQPASDPESPIEEKVKTDVPEGEASKESEDGDEELVQEPEPKPEEEKDEDGAKDEMGDDEAGHGEEKDSMKDDEAEGKNEEKKEEAETLSAKGRLISERIKEKLGEDGMICLSSKANKVEEEESTAGKKSPIKKKTRVVLPPTLEEDEDEDEKELQTPKKRSAKPSSPRKRIEAVDDETDSEREDRKEKPRRKSSKSSIKKVEDEGKEEKEKELDSLKKETLSEPTNEDSDSSDSEKEDEKPKPEEDEEANTHVDKMEEDVDADAETETESSGSSGEDTDMSTDADEALVESVESPEEEEDVAMSEDGDDSEEPENSLEEKRGSIEEKQEKGDEADNEDDEKSSTPVNPDSKTSDEEVKKPKRVTALVLSHQPEDVEVVSTPKTPSNAATLRYNFSITKTPKSPRSPRLFKHDLVPSSPLGLSIAKKKKALLKPEIERDASLWMLGKTSSGLHPKRRRQLPFNPANVSRHAYRDSDSDDGEDMYTHHHHGFQSSRWEADDAEDDDVYLRVGWGWDGRGRYNSWMMEHGGALLEFCVSKLEGFNMAW